VGRLLPAFPFALLLVAAGAWLTIEWIATRWRTGSDTSARNWLGALLAAALLLPAAMAAHADLATPLSSTREAQTVAAMATWLEDARERGGAVLVEDPELGDDIERVHTATYRLDLDRLYRFVDLRGDGAATPVDSRPALFWHGALGALQSSEIAQPCGRLWFVAPEIADQFLTAWHAAGCAGAPDSVTLP
jgi:hypothetical protein